MKRYPNPRVIAFCALYESATLFLAEYFDNVRSNCVLRDEDMRLAQEIANGVMRRHLTLDYIAKQFAKHKRLKLKKKEKIILYMALYQLYFMDKIPFYAIASESKKLCEKFAGETFLSFLIAILKKAEKAPLKLPSDQSIVYSIPKDLLEMFKRNYPWQQLTSVLQLFNQPPNIMVRLRECVSKKTQLLLQEIGIQDHGLVEMFTVPSSLVPLIKNLKGVYFQNATHVYIMKELAKNTPHPHSILDLCAAPGGKLLLLHDLYPNAKLYANEISPMRLVRLKENIKKYGIDVVLSQEDAKAFSSKEAFDLIVIDAPCTNSGVLHRRPEARWRFSKGTLQALVDDQIAMIKRAVLFLSQSGRIWYLTCSILAEENEKVIAKVCRECALQVDGEEYLVLPNQRGWDGGFGTCLRRSK